MTPASTSTAVPNHSHHPLTLQTWSQNWGDLEVSYQEGKDLAKVFYRLSILEVGQSVSRALKGFQAALQAHLQQLGLMTEGETLTGYPNLQVALGTWVGSRPALWNQMREDVEKALSDEQRSPDHLTELLVSWNKQIQVAQEEISSRLTRIEQPISQAIEQLALASKVHRFSQLINTTTYQCEVLWRWNFELRQEANYFGLLEYWLLTSDPKAVVGCLQDVSTQDRLNLSNILMALGSLYQLTESVQSEKESVFGAIYRLHETLLNTMLSQDGIDSQVLDRLGDLHQYQSERYYNLNPLERRITDLTSSLEHPEPAGIQVRRLRERSKAYASQNRLQDAIGDLGDAITIASGAHDLHPSILPACRVDRAQLLLKVKPIPATALWLDQSAVNDVLSSKSIDAIEKETCTWYPIIIRWLLNFYQAGLARNNSFLENRSRRILSQLASKKGWTWIHSLQRTAVEEVRL